MNPILNIAGYKFCDLPESQLPQWRTQLKAEAIRQQLKGTITLTPEGVNIFLAGKPESIAAMQQKLQAFPEIGTVDYKESWSSDQPFTRMIVKVKQQIVPMNEKHIQPQQATAPYITPKTFKQRLAQKDDMLVLDTRNDYEIKLGTFDGAKHLDLESFREFSSACETLLDQYQDKTIVTFCTGGIRCEKAAALMLEKGFKKVYQLQGGILDYFEQCGRDHFNGECFVFDKRVALNPDLEPTQTEQCYDCRNPLTPEQQKPLQTSCPYCGSTLLYQDTQW